MISTCSELTPRAPIPDGRMERVVQPWCVLYYQLMKLSTQYLQLGQGDIRGNVSKVRLIWFNTACDQFKWLKKKYPEAINTHKKVLQGLFSYFLNVGRVQMDITDCSV